MAKSDLSALTPNARNPRKISKKKLEMLRESMAYYGDLSGIIQVEGGDLVGGHQRVEAYRSDADAKVEITQVFNPPLTNGTTAEGFVTAAGSRFAYRLVNWEDDKAKGAALAANKGAGEWDIPLVSEMMGELGDAGFDLDLTLFDANERNSLLAEDVEPEPEIHDEDETPVEVETRAKPGDIFLLGKHRLMCGDSTNPQHVAALMNKKKFDFLFTSPPYMQQRDYGKIIDDWRRLMHDVFSLLPAKEDAQILVNLGLVHKDCEWVPYWDEWIEDMRLMGWRRFAFYVWSKSGGGMPGEHQGRLCPSWEPIFHFNRQTKDVHKTKDCLHAGHEGYHAGQRNKGGDTEGWSKQGPVNTKKIASSIIDAPTAKGQKFNHPAQFSTALCVEAIEPFTCRGDIVYEPFAGAGTMLIAADQTGRVCCAMEMEPKYCDIILARWEEHSGEVAILENDT